MRLKIKLLALLFTSFSLHAQEMGESAADSAATARSNNWQNWTFAGSAVLTAALGIFFITIDSGASPHGHS